VVSRGRGRVVRLSLGVDGGTLIGDLGNITVVVISGVGDGLDSAVGKGNLVRAGDIAGRIGVLGGLEVSLGVVISNTVFESIRCGLLLLDVGSGVVDSRGMVGRGVDNRGLVGRGVHNRGGVVGRGVDNRGSVVGSGVVNKRGGVVSNDMGWGMGNETVVGDTVVGNRGTVVGTTMVDGSRDNGVSTVGIGVSGLNLGKSLVVINLVDRGVASTESLGLDN